MNLTGTGYKNKFLNQNQVKKIIEHGLSKINLQNKRVLVITPDCTRSGPMPIVFRSIADTLLPRVKKLDFLIALGTHQPMSEKAINKLYGISQKERSGRYSQISIFNHHWNQRETFKRVGVISAKEIARLSKGMLKQKLVVELNKLIFNYDHLILYGPVFPHEVAGFSGGHKYFFPGIAGPDIINLTHWLGALITNYKIIGIAKNPVRAVIESAAQMVKIPRTGICAVVSEADKVNGIYVGPVYKAWQKAVKLSADTHIRYVQKPFRLVISVMPEMYEDLWTGAKGMYKLEPVVEDRGELIIYAPHIKEVSYTHGKILDRIGYHCRDYFLKQWDQFYRYPWGVLAHSTHLRGLGVFENGVEKPRIKVTLATGIPKKRCEKLGLGYLNPKGFNPADYAGRENEGILVVWRAGETLWRLSSGENRRKI